MGCGQAQPRETTCTEHGRCPGQKPSTTWSARCRRTKARKSIGTSLLLVAPKSDSTWVKRRFEQIWASALTSQKMMEKMWASTQAQVTDLPTTHLMTLRLPHFSLAASPIQKLICRRWNKTLNPVFTQEDSERLIEASNREHPKINHATSARSMREQHPSSLFQMNNSRLRRIGTEIDKVITHN